MDPTGIQVRVLLFARLAEVCGLRETTLTLTPGATAGDALNQLIVSYPDLAGLRNQLALAVDMAYVQADQPLADGDELALIPPVSGG